MNQENQNSINKNKQLTSSVSASNFLRLNNNSFYPLTTSSSSISSSNTHTDPKTMMNTSRSDSTTQQQQQILSLYNRPVGSFSNGTFTYTPPLINPHLPTVNLNLLNLNKYAHLETFQLQQNAARFLTRQATATSNLSSQVPRPKSTVLEHSSEQEYLDKGFLNLLLQPTPNSNSVTSAKTKSQNQNQVNKKKAKSQNLIDLEDSNLDNMSVFDLFDPLTIKEKRDEEKQKAEESEQVEEVF